MLKTQLLQRPSAHIRLPDVVSRLATVLQDLHEIELGLSRLTSIAGRLASPCQSSSAARATVERP